MDPQKLQILSHLNWCFNGAQGGKSFKGCILAATRTEAKNKSIARNNLKAANFFVMRLPILMGAKTP